MKTYYRARQFQLLGVSNSKHNLSDGTIRIRWWYSTGSKRFIVRDYGILSGWVNKDDKDLIAKYNRLPRKLKKTIKKKE